MLDKNSENRVHVEAIEEPQPGTSIAFGLEKMGLIAIKAPIVSVIILFALMVAAMFGIERIKFYDSLSLLFRSDSKDFKQYEAVTKRFPATEFDVLMCLVEARGKAAVDVLPGGFMCSGSFKGVCTGREVLDVTAGAAPLRSIFSKEQRAFYAQHAPPRISMESLVTLGPTYLLKAKHNPKNFIRGIVVEMWLYPDGSRILEISTKCLPEEAFQVGVEFKLR